MEADQASSSMHWQTGCRVTSPASRLGVLCRAQSARFAELCHMCFMSPAAVCRCLALCSWGPCPAPATTPTSPANHMSIKLFTSLWALLPAQGMTRAPKTKGSLGLMLKVLGQKGSQASTQRHHTPCALHNWHTP